MSIESLGHAGMQGVSHTVATETHTIEEATVDVLAAKVHVKGITRGITDWSPTFEDGVPENVSFVTKATNNNRYYYFQWRKGERINSEHLDSVNHH